MSARELAEWRILAELQREVEQLVAEKVPVDLASEMVLAGGEEREDDGGAL